MSEKIKLKDRNFLEKLIIHWHTRNYGRKLNNIALLLAVAIFTNKAVYSEELDSAKSILNDMLLDEKSVNNIMEFILLKLKNYEKDNTAWLEDKLKVKQMILKDEELFSYLDTIFESDHYDSCERIFLNSLKESLTYQ